MGALTSRPKVPKQPKPQIVYVPAPAPEQTSTAAIPGVSAEVQNTQPEESAEEKQAQARTNNLLMRGRGRRGTITTSFRGLLGVAGNAGRSKTLLGE